MRWKVTTAPTSEPVTIQEAMAHLRVTNNDERAYIADLIGSARTYVEAWCRRALVTQTITLNMDCFPGGDFALPLPPLVSVTSIKYYDTAAAQQTLATSVYLVDTSSDDRPGQVRLKYNQVWPAYNAQPNTIEVIYVSGYGDSTAVPEHFKHAIKLLVGHWYVNRESVLTGMVSKAIEHALHDLLWTGRVLEAV